MPWQFNLDEQGRSPEREHTIAECKRCWSYESPFPDYDLITEEVRSRDIYGRLRIPYDENLSQLAEIVTRYISEWNPRIDDDGKSFCKTPTINYSFPEYDAFIVHCLVRHLKPKRIIELGSGMSTRVLVDAGNRNQTPPSITCVDKYTFDSTKAVLGQLGVKFLDQDITAISMELYEALEENDVLFIDSSHVLKNFGDVELEFMMILPTLKPGVVVHVHDIFLPYNYPSDWIIDWKCVLTEQQVLAAYLHDNARVEILAANAYNSARGICVPEEIEYKAGGSFWFKIK
ncbi:class I SAM-dependent methyltransferase [Methylobacterium sp. PvR107]|uniref:class I SAM-dependent methyltransferase n=1 Tax=Methylobacterium sp. PvR107 TaxID=2806597 RepID=UPI001AE4042E|nr:class I SAM-dependent methyltransferase [Methylobacterium sp. PvR107]MBP1178476.1 putative O-methyltransferase YrrM [Methylobacterium sp. PvR107]